MTSVKSDRTTSSASPSARRDAQDLSVHVVRHGDTLWGIARDHGVTLDALMRANPKLQQDPSIFAGTRVRLPASDVVQEHAPEATPRIPASARQQSDGRQRVAAQERAARLGLEAPAAQRQAHGPTRGLSAPQTRAAPPETDAPAQGAPAVAQQASPPAAEAAAPEEREPVAQTPAPPGVSEHFDGHVRIMTLNVRKLVPASVERLEGPGSTESEAALRDVASYIKAKNPDVIVLQELDHDVAGPQAQHGVAAQLSKLATLVGATGQAMAPSRFDARGNGYDNAILTRNGFTIEDNISVPLSVDTQRAGNTAPRSVGVADVVAPDGTSHVNVLYTHTSPHAEGARDRKVQLAQIARIVDDLSDGELVAPDVTQGGAEVTFRSAPGAATLVGGDLNTGKQEADRALRGGMAGLENIIDGVPAQRRQAAAAGSFIRPDGGVGPRLDHLYVSRGVDVLRALVQAVARNEVQDPRGVTDHRAVIADVKINGNG